VYNFELTTGKQTGVIYGITATGNSTVTESVALPPWFLGEQNDTLFRHYVLADLQRAVDSCDNGHRIGAPEHSIRISTASNHHPLGPLVGSLAPS
jgi:hypothetical protein